VVSENKANLSEALLRSAVIDDHINELESIPTEEELKARYTISHHHEVRMKALLRKEQYRILRYTIFNNAKRAAIFAIILSALFFGMLMTNSEVRASVSNVISEWFDGFTRFIFPDNPTAHESTEWVIGFVPDGFVKTERIDIGYSSLIVYANVDNIEVMLHYAPTGYISFAVDDEQAEFERTYFNGIEFHMFVPMAENYPSRIIWTQDGFAFLLEGHVSIDELLRMAHTVTKK